MRILNVLTGEVLEVAVEEDELAEDEPGLHLAADSLGGGGATGPELEEVARA